MPGRAAKLPVVAPRSFATAAGWRQWLAAHHGHEPELLVGFQRRKAAQGMSWSESVDEALCFGWIDAVRRRVDATRYCIRFVPRRPGSIWSKVNIAKAEALIAAGRMAPAGLAAYRQRTAARSGVYSFEQGEVALDPAHRAALEAAPGAAAFFAAQPPWYRKKAAWWVQRAQRSATRARRLARLVELSALGRRLP